MNTSFPGVWWCAASILCVALAGCAETPAPAAVADAAAGADTGQLDLSSWASLDGKAQEWAGTDTGAETDAGADAGAGTDAGAGADAGAGTDAAVGSCVLPVAPGLHAVSCAGLLTQVLIPSKCPPAGCGLVCDVHGMTMDADMEDANTRTRKLGEELGFIVLQPNAQPAPPQSSWVPAIDDAKVWNLLQVATATLAVDPKRIHFMGFSQGGWMTWRMLCKHAEFFASVAPASGCSFMGTEGCAFAAGQQPAVEVPVLYMHGTKDVLQPFWCGQQQADAVVQGWSMAALPVVAQGDKYLWRAYRSSKGTDFQFIQHDWAAAFFGLQGHCYPGSSDQSATLPGQFSGFGCKPPNDFAWGEVALKFFVAHPKKP